MSILIAGGGMSGLSLAAHLAAEPRLTAPVTVVDDGSRPLDEMSWSFWADEPGLLDDAVSRRFERLRVHARGRTRTLGLGRFRYQVVRGADLRSAVEARTRSLPHFGFRAGHVDRIADGVAIVDGRPCATRWIFDSVLGSAGPPAEAHLVFRGWRVRTSRPVFDPETPTFFDFRTPVPAAFVYVLPESAEEALVEHTAFVAAHTTAPDAADQRAALVRYLTEVLEAGDYSVRGEEAATLPLCAEAPRRAEGAVMRIGTKAGLLKATTGYAYQRVQRDSAAIVRSLVHNGHPYAVPDPPGRFRLFDGALLDLLANRPDKLEEVFDTLFRAPTAETALRFLDGRTSPREERRLFSGMPAGLLATAVGRRLLAGRRRP